MSGFYFCDYLDRKKKLTLQQKIQNFLTPLLQQGQTNNYFSPLQTIYNIWIIGFKMTSFVNGIQFLEFEQAGILSKNNNNNNN